MLFMKIEAAGSTVIVQEISAQEASTILDANNSAWSETTCGTVKQLSVSCKLQRPSIEEVSEALYQTEEEQKQQKQEDDQPFFIDTSRRWANRVRNDAPYFGPTHSVPIQRRVYNRGQRRRIYSQSAIQRAQNQRRLKHPKN